MKIIKSSLQTTLNCNNENLNQLRQLILQELVMIHSEMEIFFIIF